MSFSVEQPRDSEFLDKRLNVSRETELLHSFVRRVTGDNEETLIDSANDTENLDSAGKSGGKKTQKSSPTQTVESKSKSLGLGGENTKKSEKSSKTAGKTNGKRKKIKNGPKREELYCDKDRAAAVNMGSKDIKHSLKMKRKQDRSQALQIPEEAEPATFLALGNYEMGKGEFEIAHRFMCKALELNPLDKGALVARSKCRILLGRSKEALEDAENALSVDKHFLKAIFQKAEALYYLGDFEHALVYYHRGLHVQPDREDFKLGVQKAQRAIENTIGSKVIMGGSRNGRKSGGSSSQKSATNTTATPQVRAKTAHSTTSRKSRLLRELAPDKDYLDKLMNDPNIKCHFKEDNSEIIEKIRETVNYLNARQEFWRQQLPSHLK